MNNRYVLLLILPLFFIGCVKDPKIEFKKPPQQIPKPLPVVKHNKGSLYSLKGPSLFADKKDLQIGDLIQVEISESMTSDTSNKREITGDRTNSLGGGLFSGTSGNVLGGTVSSVTSKANSLLGVDFGTSSSSSNNGEVSTALNEEFSTTVSAIIEETYQNGNYYIKGFKELLIDGQKQSLTISGVIRPYDITSDNSISSSQIANLKILYTKDGEEQDVMHVPWGLRIIQKFWPF